MAPPGVEIIIGGANDARLGPTVLLGLGGTAAEAMGDVTMRLAPLGWNEAASMIEDLQGRTLLEGWRGAPAVDRKAICRAIVAVGDLMIRHGEIRELDLNPVRVYPDGLLALDALVMALWRRRPEQPVTVHSDQGSQFTGHDWQDFLRDHKLICSMSRRGNCHDNAVAESFFQLLKRERIRRQIYPTRDDARADVFNYIEMFYNPKRRHGTAGDTSPVEFERRHSQRLKSV